MDKKSEKKEMPKMSLEELARQLVGIDLGVFEDEPEGDEESKPETATVGGGLLPPNPVPAAGGR